MEYAERLVFIHALLFNESLDDAGKKTDLKEFNALDAADYLACYFTFQGIQGAERSPAEERTAQFDMLSVYQCFALLVYAFIARPLNNEGKEGQFDEVQIVVAKTLFSGVSDEEMVEIIQNGLRKFQLIAEAEAEHWVEFREMLDKVTVSYIIAATDDESPHDQAEILPLFGQLLSQLCEAFSD